MCEDTDIKIASEKPSEDIKRNAMNSGTDMDTESIHRGRALGEKIAELYMGALLDQGPGAGEGSEEMLLQRQILLSFAALSGFERFCKNSDAATSARSTFFEVIKNRYKAYYGGATDNGALSFYYLAFRRGSEVERRIGQTFAMLCSHDGDPVYQELGEALYCWFTSVVKKTAKEIL